MLKLSSKHWCTRFYGLIIMGVVNVVIFHLVIISEATNDFLPGDNKDLLN